MKHVNNKSLICLHRAPYYNARHRRCCGVRCCRAVRLVRHLRGTEERLDLWRDDIRRQHVTCLYNLTDPLQRHFTGAMTVDLVASGLMKFIHAGNGIRTNVWHWQKVLPETSGRSKVYSVAWVTVILYIIEVDVLYIRNVSDSSSGSKLETWHTLPSLNILRNYEKVYRFRPVQWPSG